MYSYEHMPFGGFAPGRRRRTSQYPPSMSRPVSKNFNRISDFIFPDTVHVSLPPSSRQHHHHHHHHQQQQQQQQQRQQFINQRYQRTDNYSLPVLNQRDLIIVERLPIDELDDIDFVYREQYHQPNRSIQRRYSSTGYEYQVLSNEKHSTGLKNRSGAYREKLRDKRKRHTTDNAYHSILKTIVEKDQQPCKSKSNRNSNLILSYRTTLDPITDSESMTSINQENHQRRHNNDTSRYRVPINGAEPIMNEHARSRQFSSTISTRDSSSDTEITERHPKTMNCIRYQQDSSYVISPDIPAHDWEHLSSNDVHLQHQPNRFNPIAPTMVDASNYETVSNSNNLISSSVLNNVINNPINNQISSKDSTHHVSLCVNDLHTTLFIDEDTLNSTKANISNNNDKKVHMRKRNTLTNGSIITDDNYSHTEIRKRKTDINHQSVDLADENKRIRPYFLIKPQSLLMLPNETAKLKCCFAGDPQPTLVWSHNESRIPDMQTSNDTTLSRYRTHKLHDINYLEIGPINLSDHGQIRCTIMNGFGREEVITQLLVVPSPADATPYIVQPLNDIIVVEGQPLKLSCAINGLQVTVNWFHNGRPISSMTQIKSDYNNERSIFSLSPCMKVDAGTVDCLVKNRFGEARTTCHIEVVSKSEVGNR
ncbi:unnamed protein product [Rotaria socialis]|uniref:Ig-like domain-containing protein n=1 Tax=Rotaria socialis TaxID=392032 RepID=A0A819ZMT9_9BILA|nr:unnamed protein product [Rotaria socialis]CAF4165819.1 unnamed protein product [Rotaria socialis]